MENNERNQARAELIQMLTGRLSILRATIGIFQGELAECIGVSRQTYCSLEQGTRKMSWGNIFVTLFVFISNEETYNLLKISKGFIARVYKVLQYKSDEKLAQYPQGIEK